MKNILQDIRANINLLKQIYESEKRDGIDHSALIEAKFKEIEEELHKLISKKEEDKK